MGGGRSLSSSALLWPRGHEGSLVICRLSGAVLGWLFQAVGGMYFWKVVLRQSGKVGEVGVVRDDQWNPFVPSL